MTTTYSIDVVPVLMVQNTIEVVQMEILLAEKVLEALLETLEPVVNLVQTVQEVAKIVITFHMDAILVAVKVVKIYYMMDQEGQVVLKAAEVVALMTFHELAMVMLKISQVVEKEAN